MRKLVFEWNNDLVVHVGGRNVEIIDGEVMVYKSNGAWNVYHLNGIGGTDPADAETVYLGPWLRVKQYM